MVFLKHFVPPIIINACLGTVYVPLLGHPPLTKANLSMGSLWGTYAMTSSALEPHIGSHSTTMAALSGATAGGVQALVAAPAENVRLVLEGGSGASWSAAWKEVFRGTVPISSTAVQRE